MLNARLDIRAVGILLALIICLMGASEPGCAGSEEADLAPATGNGEIDELLLEAQAHLARHDVESAQSTYAGIIADYDDPPGAAHAGKALTDLLLLPGSEPVSKVLVDHLGATSGIDANDAIYDDEGYLYWLARGVPWNDQGDYSGIRTLIDSELPWRSEKLASLEGFFTGLDTPGNDIVDDVVHVADAMAQIEREIQLAVQDPDFEWIYVPGRTFHHDDLDLILGRSELNLIASLLASTRGSVYFAAAYEHSWTLDEALGSQAGAEREAKDDWTTVDYATDYFDSRLARRLREPGHLLEARDAFDKSLGYAGEAITTGISYSGETTLNWRSVDQDYAAEVVEFIEVVRQSLYGPKLLPGSTPQTRMDLSVFFNEGRVLDPDIPWFEPIAAEPDAPEAIAYWRTTDQARQAFFVDGVFDPAFDVREGGPELEINGERSREFHRAVTGDLEKDVEDAYFTTR